jgi:hypothetical protein
MRVSFSYFGSLARTERLLKNIQQLQIDQIVQGQAKRGVAALASATPTDSGRAASSWGYKVTKTANSVTIIWTNSDVENGFHVALAIQYGHGTGTGGYVQGQDYINPAMRPVFDDIAKTVWKAVIKA